MKSLKSVLPGLAVNVAFLIILLLSAGRLTCWPAWAYAALGVLMSAFTEAILRRNPELAMERRKPGPGAKAWDKKLLGLGFLLTLAMLAVAGLDAGRYHWNPRLSWHWSVAGSLLSLVGMVVFLLALKENRFSSAVVRIQRDRGHSVCSSGPYRIVRHPGNAGMIIGTIGLPLLLMSAWSAIPAAFSVAMMVARTHLEDAVLAAELDGYRDYQRTTRCRLIPGVW